MVVDLRLHNAATSAVAVVVAVAAAVVVAVVAVVVVAVVALRRRSRTFNGRAPADKKKLGKNSVQKKVDSSMAQTVKNEIRFFWVW